MVGSRLVSGGGGMSSLEGRREDIRYGLEFHKKSDDEIELFKEQNGNAIVSED